MGQTHPHIFQLARQSEKALGDECARADTTEKRAALADSTNHPGRGRPKKRCRRTRVVPSDDENTPNDDKAEEDDNSEDKIHRANHKYVITEGWWFSGTVESVLETKLSHSYEEKNRFTNNSQRKQGEMRAARELLPEELRDDLRKEWCLGLLDRKFDKGMSRQRSNTSSRLRNEIEAVFSTHLKALDPERFKDVSDVLDEHASSADLIGGKKNRWVDIHNPKTFLHSKLIMHVAAAIIFGKQKARALATGKGSGSTSKCMQDIHQIFGTTPGIICNAAIATLWTLSADVTLRKQGQQTGVNWHLFGEQIHEWLLNGLCERHEPVLRLFCEWDNELFLENKASLGAALGTGQASVEDLQEALNALRRTRVVEIDGSSMGERDEASGAAGADGMDGDGDGSENGAGDGSQADDSGDSSQSP
ncbi:hypothetical protein DFH08DRAFT_818804 [Mycena albidolilacea]|uniref:Uncharacterized protein n=1 Tax=Mycena albidolilacea TaxID=1033008 RepID=A0AAD6ZFX4_9AGAR|nr:hypothetical protein DFH08DRAFT_818804 [Mycena albidolilacea]